MVIKTYLKTLLKMFRRHIARFISLVAMVVISIGFVSGIGSAADKIDYSLDNYYRNQNVSDFIIKSKSAKGFTDEEINNLRAYFEGADIDGGMSIDLPVNAEEKLSLRLYFLDFENWTVNVPALIDGKAPETVLEAYCEQSDDVIKGYSVGEEVDLSPYGFALKVKISGVIQSPAPTVWTALKISSISIKRFYRYLRAICMWPYPIGAYSTAIRQAISITLQIPLKRWRRSTT